MSDEDYMGEALDEARAAAAAGEVPIGAVLVCNDRVLSRGRNETIRANDPTAHAEVLAVRRAAAALGNYRLSGTTLFTTLEPCAMCAGALVWARVARVVIGARDPKAGAAGSVLGVIPHPKLNHRPEVVFGVRESECAELLTAFFEERRRIAAAEAPR